MSRRCVILAFFVSVLYVGSGQADSCPAPFKGFNSWDSLYKSFRLYRQCDDGAIGESYSESVARILVDHWNTLPELALLAHKDTEFRGFVLKHIDATLDAGDLAKVHKKASAQCPAGLRKLCGDVEKQAKLALKELH